MQGCIRGTVMVVYLQGVGNGSAQYSIILAVIVVLIYVTNPAHFLMEVLQKHSRSTIQYEINTINNDLSHHNSKVHKPCGGHSLEFSKFN